MSGETVIANNASILESVSGADAVITNDVPAQMQVVADLPLQSTKVSRARNGAGPEVLLASCPADVKTWTKLVNESPTPDVYFRPGYAAAYASDKATALALLLNTSRRRFLLPFLLRKLVVPLSYPGDDYDATTPYGYGGVLPLDRGEVTREDAAEMLEQLRCWCINARVVSFMLRLHPLLRQHSAFSASIADCSGGGVRNVGPTAAIDLLAWDDALCGPAGMNNGRRSDLLHARRHLTSRLTSCESAEAPEMMQQFRSIYEETMSRVNASPFYFFPDEYYMSLLYLLRSDMAVGVAYYNGQPVGAALFLADSQFGHYHLSGVTREGKQHKAQTMMVVEGAQWMRRRGCLWLHLGGGRAPADSLYYFKRSFGASTFHYSYLALIVNRTRYDQLVNLRRAQTELATPVNEFFPAYRGPEQ